MIDQDTIRQLFKEHPISSFDIVLLFLSLFLIIKATFNGFIKELISTASLFLGIGIATVNNDMMHGFLADKIENEMLLEIISFFIIFIIVFVILKIIENIFNAIIKQLGLKGLDRFLGFFLGLIEAIILVFFIIIILNKQNIIDMSDFLNNNFLNNLIKVFGDS